MTSEDQLRADMVEVGRRLHDRGLIAATEGNLTARLGDRCLLTTPKGVSKGYMTPDMLVVTDLNGKKISGDRDPSSEILMHLVVYQHRPEVQAAVHAHPPVATGFATAGMPLDRAVLAEVVTTLGSIPIAEYATPSTQEMAEAVRKHIKTHDGLLLANHGALTVGSDLFSALYKMETVEQFARISLVTRLLGREHLLSREEVSRLQQLRGSYGIAAPAPICADGAENVEDPNCQVIQAPSSPGARLVPQEVGAASAARRGPQPDGDEEIRLTYRELTALIEDAIRNLR